MQNVDLKILEDILTLHLLKDKGELYFELLKNEEERERFLTGIRKIILFENNNNELLNDFLASYKFGGYFLNINSIKDEFIESIYEGVILGNISLESNTLLESDNPTLNENLEFLSNLKKAYKIQGRKELKEHLTNLEELSKFDLSEDLLKKGAKAQIRNDLKARFNNLENSVNDKEYYKPDFNTSTQDYSPNSISTFAKYALAALFIGIISVTSIVYNFRNFDNDNKLASNEVKKDSNNLLKAEDLKDNTLGLAKIDKQSSDVSKNYGINKEQTVATNQNILADTTEKKHVLGYKKDEEESTRGEMDEVKFAQTIHNKLDYNKFIQVKIQLDNTISKKSFKYVFNSDKRELTLYTSKELIVEEYLESKDGYLIKLGGVYYKIINADTPVSANKLK